MSLMRAVEAMHFETETIRLHHRMYPPVGFSRFKNIRNRRQIDQMNAALSLGDVPIVRVAEDVSLDLSARLDDCKEFFRVLQAGGRVALLRIVVSEYNGRLGGIGIESFGKPITLSVTQQTGCHVSCLQ